MCVIVKKILTKNIVTDDYHYPSILWVKVFAWSFTSLRLNIIFTKDNSYWLYYSLYNQITVKIFLNHLNQVTLFIDW